MSIYTISTVFFFLFNAFLLPLAAHAFLSSNFSALRKDTTFARCGSVAAAIGLLGIGLAPRMGVFIAALIVYTLITAYDGGILGLLSQLAGEDNVAAMFATSRVLASIGALLSQPLFHTLFRSGSKQGKAWSGLPYIVVGCTYALTAAVIFAVTSTTAGRELEEDEQE